MGMLFHATELLVVIEMLVKRSWHMVLKRNKTISRTLRYVTPSRAATFRLIVLAPVTCSNPYSPPTTLNSAVELFHQLQIAVVFSVTL